MTKQPIKFSPEAQAALDLMEQTSQNLFLTGKAGTGKSTLLEFFRSETNKKCAVVAPTGVAALNVKGETLHAFFGLKPGFELDEAKHTKRENVKRKKMYQSLDMIIIDEISMVRADMLDAVDTFLRIVRNDQRPFGGLQMIFIGDLYQLPPVVTSRDRDWFFAQYEVPFFFGSLVANHPVFELEYIELQTIYRQSDQDFITLLNAIRNKTVKTHQLETLNERLDADFVDDDGYVYLMTTNRDANTLNEKKLAELKTEEQEFWADINGRVEKNMYPTNEELMLKEGAQVMFVNNDSDRRWVNGSIGTIMAIDPVMELVVVEMLDGVRVEVQPFTWEISRYVFKDKKFERELIGSYTQFPLKLAWAMTIHKSQGKTFDKVILDLGRGSFAHGQTYVALSRCTSFDGLVLKKPVRPSDVKIEYTVQKFITQHQYKLSQRQWPESVKKEVLEEVIRSNQLVKIKYLKGKDELTSRVIQPLTVEEMKFKGHKFTGVIAMCQLRKSERVFNVQRILDLEVLE